MLKIFKSKRSEKEKSTKEKGEKGFFTRLTKGLKRTRDSFSEGLSNLFLGKKQIDDALLEELETRLIMADVGALTTDKILTELTLEVKRRTLTDSEALLQALQQKLLEILTPCSKPLVIDEKSKPYVILVVGVNGSGKTTTIGKLAKRFKDEEKSVMLAAGDTFRAAAVEQLKIWGERNNMPVISQPTGADSASVIYDALASAKAKNVDILLADTAGRLHTQSNLMEELKKVKRVIKKIDETAPHEVLLVLDGGTGQNAIRQTDQFNKAVDVNGIVITKLDGTAKGGILFAIANEFGLPIRFIGVGEGIDDLQPFDAEEFIKALFVNTTEG